MSQVAYAEKMMALGVHKQLSNRLLECFMYHEVIITATEWDNFDHLRRDKDAAPEIQRIAEMIHSCVDVSRPRLLTDSEWHLPFTIERVELETYGLEKMIQVSVGRSARVSYANHDGVFDPEDDLRLAERCRAGHMAPWEHVARPMTRFERRLFGRARPLPKAVDSESSLSGRISWEAGPTEHFLGNFNGWVQARKLIHGEWDIGALRK